MTPRNIVLLSFLFVACSPTGVKDDPETGTDDTAPQDTAPEETGDLPAPPTAVVDAPASARVGQTVTLDGSASSDPQGMALVGWDWTCDDGNAASGATVALAFAAAGTVSCTLTVTSETGLTGSASADIEVTDTTGAAWTVMVFMAADNDLEGAALGDVNEMEQVGSTDDVNVVVQLDRSRWGDSSDGNWSGTRRYLVQQDTDTRAIGSPVVEDLGTVDSGAPETIIDFVDWATERYPADRYALVVWNHGWGWSFAPQPAATKGVASDDATGNDISVAEGELEEVLEAASAALGRPLDLLGMDACLMGSWEVAHVARPHASVYVSSQASEGLDGWAYDTFLADLVAEPEMDPATLGSYIALRFYESRDSTQSVVDLDLLARADELLDDLAQAMIDSGQATTLLQLARGAQVFDWGGGDHDLGHYLAILAASEATPAAVVTAAEAAQAAYTDAIVANYVFGAGFQEATGLSIYTPTGRADSLYFRGSWNETSLWDDFLRTALGL